MKKRLRILIPAILGALVLLFAAGFFLIPPKYNEYSDVKNNATGNAMIEMVDRGIYVPDGSELHPNDMLTRGEFYDVALRTFGVDVSLDLNPDEGSIPGGYTMASIMAKYLHTEINMDASLQAMSLERYGMKRGDFALLYLKIVGDNFNTAPIYADTEVQARAVLNGTGITLRNIIIRGDLILGKDAAESITTLDGVFVYGKLVLVGVPFEKIQFLNGSEVMYEVVSIE